MTSKASAIHAKPLQHMKGVGGQTPELVNQHREASPKCNAEPACGRRNQDFCHFPTSSTATAIAPGRSLQAARRR